MFKAAIVLFIYAALLVAVGLVAFQVAPPEAKSRAITAVIIPTAAATLTVVAGVLCVLGKRNHKLGMIGVHVGLLLPVLFTAAVGFQGFNRTSAYLEAWQVVEAQRTIAGAETADAEAADDSAEAALATPPSQLAKPDNFSDEQWEDTINATQTGYLVSTLWAIVSLSIQCLVSLLVLRPKPAPKPATDSESASA
ncbi:MAG: hypothetical protein AAF747_07945 [Planctomycetota bacterium]